MIHDNNDVALYKAALIIVNVKNYLPPLKLKQRNKIFPVLRAKEIQTRSHSYSIKKYFL